MYPNLYYACKDLFNIHLPILKSIPTFGFFVALSFIPAMIFFYKELQRKEKLGLLTYTEKKSQGEIICIYPSDRLGDVTLIAAIFGVIGAKLFACFEEWNRFVVDPVGTIVSSSGMTFYGSLILCTIVLWYYYYKLDIPRMVIADAIAPALMIAYAVGRLGCHFSGDGDWGIVNPYATPVSWMPDWLWAYKYPHNILNQGVFIPGCDWENYCYQLQSGVYPTPLYEFVICTGIFIGLWLLRKRVIMVGRISALYLFANGAERFTTEFMRVNHKINLLGFKITQAQLIGLGCMLLGICLYFLAHLLPINKSLQKKPNDL